MSLVLQPRYSRRILYTSNVIWLSILASVLYEIYTCTLLTLLVWITSVMYWSHPVKGLRRTLDMACTAVSLAYHFYLASTAYQQMMYFTIVTIGISFYLLARISDDQNCSSFYHCIMHLCGNISNLVLYSSIHQRNIDR